SCSSLSNTLGSQLLILQLVQGLPAVAWYVSSLTCYSQSGSSLAVIVGKPLRDFSAFSWVKCAHSAGTLSSAKIASTGHSGTQASQSMHVSGLIQSISSSK